MANGHITQEQWIELYRHLLTKLEERGFVEVRAEIEAAASAPLVEESTPEDHARISKTVRGEVGRAVIRRRRPDEVFQAAVDVLQTRFVEVPAIAQRAAEALHVPAGNIEIRVDYEQRYALVEPAPVPLNRFVVDEQVSHTLRNLLETLGVRPDRWKKA